MFVSELLNSVCEVQHKVSAGVRDEGRDEGLRDGDAEGVSGLGKPELGS